MPPIIPARTLALLLFFSSLVAATNFTQCLVDFQNDTNAVGGVDSRGHPVADPAQAVGFTYETCTQRCGLTSESFNWREFTQLFSSWLLPWLALISQLPFGSGNYLDDFMSGQISCLFHSSLVLSLTRTHSLHTISDPQCRISCPGRILPRPHLSKRPISLSEGETVQA